MSDPRRRPLSPVVRRTLIALLGALILVLGGSYFYRIEAIAHLLGAAGTEGRRATVEAERARARADYDRQVAALSAKGAAEGELPAMPVGPDGYFVPPDPAAIPDGPFGDAVRRGRDIFLNPAANATAYVGNSLACSNCHLDAGRLADAAPMWAASGLYPKHRGKNDKINDMEMRINGCFTYSMNAPGSPSGGPPPDRDRIYRDLESYFFWLAGGAPAGVKLPGQGYPVPEKPAGGYDRDRGAEVFAANCSLCHGADGQGRTDMTGRYVFPPLWGPNAYNWGAGMHRVNTAAGFIYANMPLGKPFSLTPQQAWDVAAYINSHERPPDPRQRDGRMSVAEAREKFHSKNPDYYGLEVEGKVIGEGVEGDPATTASATGIVMPDPAALR